MILRWLAKKQNPKKELARLLDNFELQTFPVVVTRAMRMLRDPNSTLAAIAVELQNDPGVSARVLSLTNSAARGLSRKVSNVDHALALLGRSEVESMLLAFAVARNVGPGTIPGFDTTRFWQAAALRAVTARRLARKVDPGSLGETFTASLLQDMAVPVLAHARGKPYVELHAQWRSDGGDLAALEQAELGWDHGYVGAAMAESWSFPESLIESISGHHAQGGPLPGAQLVSSMSDEPEPDLDRLVDAAEQAYGLQADEVRDVVAAAAQEADEIGRLFVGV